MHAELGIIRPRDLASTEKSSSFRLIFKTIRAVAPTKALPTESIYGYMRHLDDLVDQNSTIGPVKALLSKEMEGMRNGQDTDLQREMLGDSFEMFSDSIREQVRKRLLRIMTGLSIDA